MESEELVLSQQGCFLVLPVLDRKSRCKGGDIGGSLRWLVGIVCSAEKRELGDDSWGRGLRLLIHLHMVAICSVGLHGEFMNSLQREKERVHRKMKRVSQTSSPTLG